MAKKSLFKKSFTLIELLISATIVGLISTALVGIFVQSLKMQQTSQRLQALQDDTRFLLERISQEARTGTIDYEAYGGTALPGPVLYLIDQDGTKIQIALAGNLILLNGVNITPTNLKVKSLKFTPYPKEKTDVEQRIVQLSIEVSDLDNQSSMILNLAATSRMYDAWP